MRHANTRRQGTDCTLRKRHYGAPMLRILALLALLPTYASADWSPRPNMFTYDATFANCTADPAAADLARTCADALGSAYVLKRAVALATVKCHPEDLATCAVPFEDEGLPAIAMRIAVDSGCDATDVLRLPEGEVIPPNHCITVASDIMIDEGIVPLYTQISCGVIWIECGDLANIHATFWAQQVQAATPDNSANLTQMRQETARLECNAEGRAGGGWSTTLVTQECLTQRNAALWADLAQQTEQDQ